MLFIQVTSQEYDNPAYVDDGGTSYDNVVVIPPVDSDNNTSLSKSLPLESLGIPATTGNNLQNGSPTSLTPPPGDMGRRRSSIADIALALNPGLRKSSSPHNSMLSLMEMAAPYYFQRANYFRHPFGSSTSIVEQLFPLEEEYREFKKLKTPGGKHESQSPAKLVLWIVFTLFMVAVGGAIILGAGTC